ncbi:MAG: hypothetical protein JRD89_19955 [Deltaproteobacteria bacterium]|nr:hypothetical protein [Deltaproteobacteria bacterium]
MDDVEGVNPAALAAYLNMLMNRRLCMAYHTKESDPVNGNITKPTWWIQIIIVSITVIAVGIITFLGIKTYEATRNTALDQFNQHQLILAHSAAAGISARSRPRSYRPQR